LFSQIGFLIGNLFHYKTQPYLGIKALQLFM